MEDFAKKRLEICKECPLFDKTESGPRCSSKRYINKDKKVSWLPKDGYIRGCNCYLEYKVTVPSKKCPAGFW